ncbi:MAG: response regulator transcription factor [Chitinophagaceae bacterium]
MTNTAQKILVVEDDPDIGMMLKMMLEYKGYTVTVSERAEQANDIIRSNADLNLIIMDMLLSGSNGIDICAGLKQDTTTSHLPVIMISAHPNAREICLQAGADDFIEKPFEMDALLNKVNSLIIKQ